MTLVDTHCHIHSSDYGLPADEARAQAAADGVAKLICVGTDAADSRRAVEFAALWEGCYAAVGLHPHDARDHAKQFGTIAQLASEPKVVAIGECGLDYYYEHSPPKEQLASLDQHLALADEHKLSLIFHIREAFSDFWPVFDRYPGLKGVVHSFTAGKSELEAVLSRGLYLGLNGIMTFTADQPQLAAAKAIPLDRLVLETDAPYLTPKPFRGKINEPKHIVTIATFLATLRGETVEEVAQATTTNVRSLFGI